MLISVTMCYLVLLYVNMHTVFGAFRAMYL